LGWVFGQKAFSAYRCVCGSPFFCDVGQHFCFLFSRRRGGAALFFIFSGFVQAAAFLFLCLLPFACWLWLVVLALFAFMVNPDK
jgi:hypothetical protein